MKIRIDDEEYVVNNDAWNFLTCVASPQKMKFGQFNTEVVISFDDIEVGYCTKNQIKAFLADLKGNLL
jgi:hypothetical protein